MSTEREAGPGERALAPAWRRAVRWYFTVRSDDLVRRTLNQAFLAVDLMLIAAGATFATLFSTLLSDRAIVLACLAMLPVLAFCALLARRGSAAGAILLATLICVSNAAIYVPATYANPPIIHVIFILPALIYALFVAPWSGFVGAAAQTLALSAALAAAGVAGAAVGAFVIIALLNLLVIAAPLVIAAQLVHRALARHAALAARLDSEVRARTGELQQLMRLREQDITGVVHDINNRMMVVQAEVEELLAVARAALPESEPLAMAERRTEDAIDQLNRLVEDLRTAAQLEHTALRLQLAPVDLGALAVAVADQLRVQAAVAGCRLELSRPEPLPPVSADRRQIERVLANLLGNAIKYSQQVAPERRVVAVSADRDSAGVTLRVADRGPGLDPESLRQLGLPFTRLGSARGTDGMGVGLYISKGIVELHGGRLSFSSGGPNTGVTATLWLPNAPAG